jgi:hypothetical protein
LGILIYSFISPNIFKRPQLQFGGFLACDFEFDKFLNFRSARTIFAVLETEARSRKEMPLTSTLTTATLGIFFTPRLISFSHAT